jgi:hypothetical protein
VWRRVFAPQHLGSGLGWLQSRGIVRMTHSLFVLEAPVRLEITIVTFSVVSFTSPRFASVMAVLK